MLQTDRPPAMSAKWTEGPLTTMQTRTLEQVRLFEDGGYHTAWRPQTMRSLAALGLVERKPSSQWQGIDAWFLTEAGRAALAKAGAT